MIETKLLADSIYEGTRLTTVQIKMPRYILPQISKHRQFSLNAESSRAIPIEKMIERAKNDPVIPKEFGANGKGMVPAKALEGKELEKAKKTWLKARDNAVKSAEAMLEAGVHKQLANRILEPFLYTNVIISATEWDNFFHQRLAVDAQDEIQEIARQIKNILDSNTPKTSKLHLPYVTDEEIEAAKVNSEQNGFEGDTEVIKLFKISAARCARLSYSNHGTKIVDIEKDLKLADFLIEHLHLTPLEHSACIPNVYDVKDTGNIKQWNQFRKLVEAKLI